MVSLPLSASRSSIEVLSVVVAVSAMATTGEIGPNIRLTTRSAVIIRDDEFDISLYMFSLPAPTKTRSFTTIPYARQDLPLRTIKNVIDASACVTGVRSDTAVYIVVIGAGGDCVTARAGFNIVVPCSGVNNVIARTGHNLIAI